MFALVIGVQTCALPILGPPVPLCRGRARSHSRDIPPATARRFRTAGAHFRRRPPVEPCLEPARSPATAAPRRTPPPAPRNRVDRAATYILPGFDEPLLTWCRVLRKDRKSHV